MMTASLRLLTILVMCLTAVSLSAQPREPSSYFAKPGKSEKTIAPSAPKLPPLPPKGVGELPPLQLPPLPASVSSHPLKSSQTAPTPPGKPEDGGTADKPAKMETMKEPDSPFLSPSALKEKRRRCQLEFTGNRVLQARATGDSITVKFKHVAGESCLSAAAADVGWVEAVINSGLNQVTLKIEGNDAVQARTALLSVIAGNDAFRFTVEQPAAERGCRRATLVRRSTLPIPEGFQP